VLAVQAERCGLDRDFFRRLVRVLLGFLGDLGRRFGLFPGLGDAAATEFWRSRAELLFASQFLADRICESRCNDNSGSLIQMGLVTRLTDQTIAPKLLKPTNPTSNSSYSPS
jgi:hypothetical protein